MISFKPIFLMRFQYSLCLIIGIVFCNAPYALSQDDITVTTFYPSSSAGGSLDTIGDSILAQDEDSHVHIGEPVHLSTNPYEGKLWVSDNSIQTDTIATPTDLVVPDIVLQNTDETDNNYNRILFVDSVGGVDSAIVGIHADADATGNSRRGQLQFLTANATGLTPRMTIDESGNVGLGTTSPMANLQIKNTLPYTAFEDDYTKDSLALYGAVADHGGQYYGGITWHDNNHRRAGIASVMEGDSIHDIGLAFLTQDTDDPGIMAETLRIASNGNIGIGTPTPTSLLTIESNSGSNLEIIAPQPTIRLEASYRSSRYSLLGYDPGVNALIFDMRPNLSDFVLKNSSATSFWLDDEGHVSIGYSAPVNYAALMLPISNVPGDSTIPAYGIYQQMYGNATGANYGIYNNGGYGSSTGTYNRLMWANDDLIGTFNYLTGGTTMSVGTYNGLAPLSPNNSYLMRSEVTSSVRSTGVNYGIHSDVRGLSAEKYGFYSLLQQDTTDNWLNYTGLSVSVRDGSSASTNYGIYAKASGGSAGNMVGVYSDGTDADFRAYNGTYHSVSSRRWKNTIKTIPNALDKILALRGVSFDWDEDHGGLQSLGFVAEEVGEVLPEIVTYEADSPTDAKSMDYSKVYPVLIEAFKEQQKLIQSQAKQIQTQTEVIQTIEVDQNNLIQEIRTLQGDR